MTRLAGDVPWAVLSSGVDHETFGQVEIALAEGASGVAGRSLWKDCVSLDRATQQHLLATKAVVRLSEIPGDRRPPSASADAPPMSGSMGSAIGADMLVGKMEDANGAVHARGKSNRVLLNGALVFRKSA